MTREQAIQHEIDAGRQVLINADGTWRALPTAEEQAVADGGCRCHEPVDAGTGYCELCDLQIRGARSYLAHPLAHQTFVASDGEVFDRD